jgi:hypothetical protein
MITIRRRDAHNDNLNNNAVEYPLHLEDGHAQSRLGAIDSTRLALIVQFASPLLALKLGGIVGCTGSGLNWWLDDHG